tara:strand:- start:786 stop:1226 length:441 start_codon:yes stop_codon:yes gene_type:complete
MKLGNLVEKIISIITLGQGKKIAMYVAKLRGKEDCGCDRRKKKLNNINFNKMQFTNNLIKLDWSDRWDNIRSQVPCSCDFDFATLYVKNKVGSNIHEERLIAAPYMNGTVKYKEVSFPSFITPQTFDISFHKTEGGLITENKIKIN